MTTSVLDPKRFVMISDDRIVYVGPNGAPPSRALGTLVIYVAQHAPFQLSVEDGPWETGELAVVHPFVVHEIRTEDALIGAVNLEPESYDRDALPPWLARSGVCAVPHVISRTRQGLAGLVESDFGGVSTSGDIDGRIFGSPIQPRRLDARVAAAVERIRRNPAARVDAEACAAQTGLSVSRFLHLFGRDLGVPFRRFRAWKRARSLLAYMATRQNLAEFALRVGYPDSTHFSHSIRTVYGLCPREIFAHGKSISVRVI